MEVIFNMDFFIQDLHQQIKQIHSNEQHRTKTTVYRSEGILYRVIERIKIIEAV